MRNRGLWIPLAIAFLVLLCSSTFAQYVPDEIKVKPWAQIFADYSYNFSGYKDYDPRHTQNDFNSFDLTRTWLGLDATLTKNWSARVVIASDHANVTSFQKTTVPSGKADDPATPEDESKQEVISGFTQNATGPFTVWVTYAYMRWQPFRYFGFDFGMIQGAYTTQIFNYWRHRYVEDNIVFKNLMIRSIYGDLGAAIGGEFPGGFGGYRFAVENGEGKKQAEQNSGKAIEAQLHIAPLAMIDALKGLQFMGFYRYDVIQPHVSKITDNFWDALAAFRYDVNDSTGFSVNGEYAVGSLVTHQTGVKAVNRMAYSLWADFWFKTQYGVLARYDYFDPNTRNDKKTGEGYLDEQTTLIAGVFYYPIKNIKLCPNYRQVGYTAKIPDKNAKLVRQQPDQFAFFNTEFNF